MLKLSNSIIIFIYLSSSLVFMSCGNKDEIKDEQLESKSTTKNAKVQKSKEAASEKPQFNYKADSYSATALGEACFRGDLQKIKNIIREGASTNSCLSDDVYVYDLLYAALEFKQIKIAEYVLKNNLYKSVNQIYTEYYHTPLTMACELPNENDALRIAEILINNGAEARGGGPNETEENTQWPIIIATKNNYPKVVKLLLDHGADKKVTDNIGETAHNIAEMGGYWEIISLLADVSTPNNYKQIGLYDLDYKNISRQLQFINSWVVVFKAFKNSTAIDSCRKTIPVSGTIYSGLSSDSLYCLVNETTFDSEEIARRFSEDVRFAGHFVHADSTKLPLNYRDWDATLQCSDLLYLFMKAVELADSNYYQFQIYLGDSHHNSFTISTGKINILRLNQTDILIYSSKSLYINHARIQHVVVISETGDIKYNEHLYSSNDDNGNPEGKQISINENSVYITINENGSKSKLCWNNNTFSSCK